MQDGFWSVFSETGDVVGYLLCRAAENASRRDGGRTPVSGGRAQKSTVGAPLCSPGPRGTDGTVSTPAGGPAASDTAAARGPVSAGTASAGGDGVSA